MLATCFNLDCTRCPRLAKFLREIRQDYPDYHARPVAPFGDSRARLLIVGLAPGLHGANRTARPFTGDHAGLLLYRSLHKFGFANQPESRAVGDAMRLRDCRITNAVKCVPPQNKPSAAEIATCNRYLSAELAGLPLHAVILALGCIAHDAVVRALNLKPRAVVFQHGAEHRLTAGRILLDSYHCSRYNTQTRRLTPVMFERVVARARRHLQALEQAT